MSFNNKYAVSKPINFRADDPDWKRNFPGEDFGWIKTLTNKFFGEKTQVLADTRQARFVDTNFYYRLGGVDPDKARLQNDILAIQWGIGGWQAETYLEQVAIANANGQRYISWWIPDPASPLSMVEQVDNMAETPGVLEAPIYVDEEPPRSTTPYANKAQLGQAITRIKEISPFPAGCYSRVNIFEALFGSSFPDYMGDVNQWIAQYPYMPGTTSLYTDYDLFLLYWAWSLTPAVTRSALYQDEYWKSLVVAWQFTSKGRAIDYIAPATLPSGAPAIKSCDLNVSMRKLDTFMSQVFAEETTPPIPVDLEARMLVVETKMAAIENAEAQILATLTEVAEVTDMVVNDIVDINAAINALVDRIENLEDDEPPAPPDEPAEYLTVQVVPDNNCSVYLPVGHDLACKNAPPEYDGPPGKPTPENKIGVFPKGSKFRIYRSGYYSCMDNPNTPEIKTGYDDHYLVYGGEFDRAMVPAKRVTIIP